MGTRNTDTLFVQGVADQGPDSGDPLNIAQKYTPDELVRFTVPDDAQEYITGAPQSATLTPGTDVLVRPLADIAANTLTDPMTPVDLLLMKLVDTAPTPDSKALKEFDPTETNYGSAAGKIKFTLGSDGKIYKANAVSLPAGTEPVTGDGLLWVASSNTSVYGDYRSSSTQIHTYSSLATVDHIRFSVADLNYGNRQSTVQGLSPTTMTDGGLGWVQVNGGAADGDGFVSIEKTFELATSRYYRVVVSTRPNPTDASSFDWKVEDQYSYNVDVVNNVRSNNRLTVLDFEIIRIATAALRREPVDIIADLKAVSAKDAMHQTVLDDGTGARKEFVFHLGATEGDHANNAATGFWTAPKIYGTVASQEIGTLKMVPNVKEDGTTKTNADYVAEGLFPIVSGYRLTDGAVDNPKFALMYPTLVSGNDLRWPQNLDGAFIRNLGGNASSILNYQADGTAVNGLRTFRTYVQSDWNGQSNNDFGKGSGSTPGANNNSTGMSSSDPETRPLNFAMQFGLTLDGYTKQLMVDPKLIPLDGAGAVEGDGVIFKDDLAGGLKLAKNDIKTYGVVASQEIGTLKMAPSVKEDGSNKVAADYVAEGGFPVINNYTLTDGATDNPLFAAMYPALVSGNDLAWPENLDGAFIRNLGGNAASMLTLQADGTAVNGLHDNGHQHSISLAHNETQSGMVGTNGTFWASRSTNTGYAQLDSTDPETRPANFAMQFVLTLDSYSKQLMIDPTLVATDTTGVADGDNVVWRDDLAGGFTLAKGPTAGAPTTLDLHQGHGVEFEIPGEFYGGDQVYGMGWDAQFNDTSLGSAGQNLVTGIVKRYVGMVGGLIINPTRSDAYSVGLRADANSIMVKQLTNANRMFANNSNVYYGQHFTVKYTKV